MSNWQQAVVKNANTWLQNFIVYIKVCLKMLIFLALSLSRSHFASNLLVELPFAFTTKVIHSAIDWTIWWNHYSESLIHIDMIGPHCGCRFVGWTFWCKSPASTHPKFITVLKSSDYEGSFKKPVWGDLAFWFGASSCWKQRMSCLLLSSFGESVGSDLLQCHVGFNFKTSFIQII